MWCRAREVHSLPCVWEMLMMMFSLIDEHHHHDSEKRKEEKRQHLTEWIWAIPKNTTCLEGQMCLRPCPVMISFSSIKHSDKEGIETQSQPLITISQKHHIVMITIVIIMILLSPSVLHFDPLTNSLVRGMTRYEKRWRWRQTFLSLLCNPIPSLFLSHHCAVFWVIACE